MAKLLWNIVKCTFDLHNIQDNTNELFNTWLKKFHKKEKDLITVGVSAIFWAIWKLRNGVVFDNNKISKS